MIKPTERACFFYRSNFLAVVSSRTSYLSRDRDISAFGLRDLLPLIFFPNYALRIYSNPKHKLASNLHPVSQVLEEDGAKCEASDQGNTNDHNASGSQNMPLDLHSRNDKLAYRSKITSSVKCLSYKLSSLGTTYIVCRRRQTYR